jgi:protein SCO1
MGNRAKIASFVLLGIMAAAGVLASYLWHRAPAVSLTTGTVVSPARELPDFSLIDQQGRAFGPANLRGHWSLMFFGYTNCPDFCPTTLTTLASLQRKLRSEGVAQLPQVVFMSVDAQRDTPEQLARYVPYFDPSFIGVTAKDQPTAESVARKLGVAVMITPAANGSYTVDHSGAIFVIDPNGRLAAVLTEKVTTDSLAADWQRLTGHS